MTTKLAPHPLHERALGWLRQALGVSAEFRADQWEAIEALVERRQRVLVVQRTGWGKSLVYFMATRLRRAQGAGPTVLISPLLSLMRNQVEAAARFGVTAVAVNSTNPDEHAAIEAQLARGEIDLLLISPERLGNDHFQKRVWSKLRQEVGLLVVDEAHCISDWGHDFRPNYRRIMRVLDELPAGTPILGTTATANRRVVADIGEILGENLRVLRGSLTRDSLSLYALPQPLSTADRLALLVEMLNKMPGSGIIYCMTTDDCVRVADWLQANGLNVKAYYADVESDAGADREALERQLLNNELKALVASVALGMGFDKPDLHFVIHYQHPGSIISYYQQIGRAGRGIDQAQIILLHGPEDIEIQRYFIDTAFPKPEHVETALAAFRENDALTMNDLQRFVNTRRNTLDKILTHLEVEKIIEKDGSSYQLIDGRRAPDYERWARVSAQRERELEQMRAYIADEDCLMRFIAAALDDDTATAACGKCQNCLNKRNAVAKRMPAPDLINGARRFLEAGSAIAIEPRKMWPAGGVAGLRGKIMEANLPGVALCNLYDSGWGATVRRERARDGVLPDDLVEASTILLQEQWAQDGITPVWMTAVPSLRRPHLVPDFAQRLAKRLQLPFHPLVQKVQERPEQSTMLNSHSQAANVAQAFAIEGKVPRGTALLVDDLVQSGWTMTVVGKALQTAGCQAVYPFALAKGGARE